MSLKDSSWMGIVGAVLGVLVLTGKVGVAELVDPTLAGCLLLGGALALMALSSLETFAEVRNQRRAREDRLVHIERLARLREQRVLTDEEFAAQKQALLAPDDPPAMHVRLERLARLRESGALTEKEFDRQKQEILLAESLERLDALWEQGSLAEDEYERQKRRLLADHLPPGAGPPPP